MIQVNIPPGLADIADEITEIVKLSNEAETKTLLAAKKLSEKILNLFQNGLLKNLLQMPAVENTEEIGHTALFPKRTFLEVALMKAVSDSQKKVRFSSHFVIVDNTELQNIGISTMLGNRVKSTSQLDEACAEISRITGMFIFCGFVQWGIGEKFPDHAQFTVNCNFLEKTIPANH